MTEGAALNTDRELYREPKGDLPGDYYAASVHVTADGQIGINVGGTVVTLPIHEWHRRVLTGMAEAWEKGYDAGDDDGYRPAPLARAIAAHRAAEAELDRLASGIEGLANEWSGPDSPRANAWLRERDVADRLRATLRAAGSRIETNHIERDVWDGPVVDFPIPNSFADDDYAECTCGHYWADHDGDGGCFDGCGCQR